MYRIRVFIHMHNIRYVSRGGIFLMSRFMCTQRRTRSPTTRGVHQSTGICSDIFRVHSFVRLCVCGSLEAMALVSFCCVQCSKVVYIDELVPVYSIRYVLCIWTAICIFDDFTFVSALREWRLSVSAHHVVIIMGSMSARCDAISRH